MHRMQVTEEKQQERNRQKPKAREQVRQEIQKENLLITEQMVTDQEEIMETVPMPVTEDRRETETVREDSRAKAELRAMEIVRADASAAREDPRVTARDARAEDHRAMEIVRVDVSAAREDPRVMARDARAEDSRAMEIVREDVSVREDHREMETVREEDRRAMARAVRTETEVKDVTDASAAVRDVRDSARRQERMTIWHLHRN